MSLLNITYLSNSLAYCYNSVDVISLSPSQSDLIKQLPLYLEIYFQLPWRADPFLKFNLNHFFKIFRGIPRGDAFVVAATDQSPVWNKMYFSFLNENVRCINFMKMSNESICWRWVMNMRVENVEWKYLM